MCSNWESNRKLLLVRTVFDKGNHLKRNWHMQENENMVNYPTIAAKKAIGHLNNTHNNIRTLHKCDKVRVDLQGFFNHENRRYLNIQVQLNKKRNGESTTIATALIETNSKGDILFPIRYIRDALVKSLRSYTDSGSTRQCWLEKQPC